MTIFFKLILNLINTTFGLCFLLKYLLENFYSYPPNIAQKRPEMKIESDHSNFIYHITTKFTIYQKQGMIFLALVWLLFF